MSDDDDLRLDELLGRGTLGGPRYDGIFERVWSRTEREARGRSRLRRRVGWGLAALVPAAVAGWLVLARPGAEPLAPKGSPGAATGALDVGCAPSGARACRVGDRLLFTVNAAVTSGHLGAYAERADAPSHARIWYFPTAAGQSPVVAAGGATVVVPQGIVIGPEHLPGHYRVTVWIAAGEIDRATGPGGARSEATFDLEILP